MREDLLLPSAKGLILDRPTSGEQLCASHPSIFSDSFSWPLLTLSDSALDHNVTTMAAVCAEHGVAHAPHVKTAMSRQLYARQAAAGAWGATVATPAQLRTVLSWGTDRVMLANQLTDPRELRWLGRTLAAAPSRTIWFWVDSLQGVDLVRTHLLTGADRLPPGLGLLVELGIPGGRTGLRTSAEALQLARAVHAAGLPLVGVAGYEGPLVDHAERPRAGRAIEYVRDLRALACAVEQEGLREWAPASAPVPVVSVGGSDLVDVILAELGEDAPGASVQGIIRSGAYLTHDHGLCARANPWQHLGLALQPAAQVWASVLSTPEGGLALANIGRRDVPFDIDLPVPLTRCRVRTDGRWGEVEPLSGWRVTGLNDQHAYLRRETTGEPNALQPGDVVAFGISHPCTLFDKWRTAVVVDDQQRVLDVLTTEF